MKKSKFKTIHYILLFFTCFLLIGELFAKSIFKSKALEMDLNVINYIIYTTILLLISAIIYNVYMKTNKTESKHLIKNSKLNSLLVISLWSTSSFIFGFFLIDLFVMPSDNKVDSILMINFYQFMFLLIFLELSTIGMLKAFTKY